MENYQQLKKEIVKKILDERKKLEVQQVKKLLEEKANLELRLVEINERLEKDLRI